MRFEVGMRVLSENDINKKVGTIVKITDKRKDIVVDFGNYKETYDLRGWQKSGDAWHRYYIRELTQEIQKQLAQERTVKQCLSLFNEKKNNLTFEKATKIIEILENGETNGH